MKKSVRKVLSIAGSDSGGGAGIQADLKTFSALGVYGTTVVTAVTAQNTREVAAIHNIPVSIIEAQLHAVLSDIGADAIKIGMLSNAETIETVGRVLKQYEVKSVVLDPVMVSATGAPLLEETAVDALKKHLIPAASVLTPNKAEAEILVQKRMTTRDEAIQAAKEIRGLGCESVLLKTAFEENARVFDLYFDGQTFREISHPRLGIVGHGAGCTLSSAIAAFLAAGESKESAVEKSVAFVQKALKSAYRVGSTHYVLGHFQAEPKD
ncbi:bifunctional hydroxymethylpyrimidine kinase/phosphomethylpyrimidine kinase [Candidatus Micrarchaeota archaeon]|nr:bifunctional hydroxymethylpyrimidine kinase/phosphomethylpyrimidine kinase [Candidatus Micrarchaeota archaeon]